MNQQCDCLECTKDREFSKQQMKVFSMWEGGADNLEGKASDFIGGTLEALKPVIIYASADTSKPIRTVKSGGTIGVIYSYVQRPDGVYWQLDDNTFVKHERGAFDELILQNSLNKLQAAKDAAIKDAAKKRTDKNENPLYNAGKTLESVFSFDTIKWVLIAVIIAVILGIFFRVKG